MSTKITVRLNPSKAADQRALNYLQTAGISYSKGWNMIHAVEHELGYKIVERQQGGKYGGKAYITQKGKQWIELFEIYEQRMNEVANDLYEEIFSYSGLL